MTKNWNEDAHLENGNHQCRCIACGEQFLGYKRRTLCHECAFTRGAAVGDPHRAPTNKNTSTTNK